MIVGPPNATLYRIFAKSPKAGQVRRAFEMPVGVAARSRGNSPPRTIACGSTMVQIESIRRLYAGETFLSLSETPGQDGSNDCRSS